LRRAQGMGKEGGFGSSWLLLKETASGSTQSLGWTWIWIRLTMVLLIFVRFL